MTVEGNEFEQVLKKELKKPFDKHLGHLCKDVYVIIIIDNSNISKNALHRVNKLLGQMVTELQKLQAEIYFGYKIMFSVMVINKEVECVLTPTEIKDYVHIEIKESHWDADFCKVLDELNVQLSHDHIFDSKRIRTYPYIILLAETVPSNIHDYETALSNLSNNIYFACSHKFVVLIGEKISIDTRDCWFTENYVEVIKESNTTPVDAKYIVDLMKNRANHVGDWRRRYANMPRKANSDGMIGAVSEITPVHFPELDPIPDLALNYIDKSEAWPEFPKVKEDIDVNGMLNMNLVFDIDDSE